VSSIRTQEKLYHVPSLVSRSGLLIIWIEDLGLRQWRWEFLGLLSAVLIKSIGEDVPVLDIADFYTPRTCSSIERALSMP